MTGIVCPGCCAARSDALLIRGPILICVVMVPALRSSVKNAAPRPGRVKRQTILKIASASTACARKPTVKASVRNTGKPSV